jgi:hypothetical protein
MSHTYSAGHEQAFTPEESRACEGREGGSWSRRTASRAGITVCALIAAVALLAACQAPPATSLDGTAAEGEQLPPPASLIPAMTTGQATAGTSSWAAHRRTLDGVTFSYRYPPGWSEDLVYCASDARKDAHEGHLHPGCATTDILVGQKARDVGQLSGETLTIDGKRAVRQLVTQPPNVLTARIYTLMVYAPDGAPLFGFSSFIGAGTGKAAQEAITAALDDVASTLEVEWVP